MKLASIEGNSKKAHVAVVIDQDQLLDIQELKNVLPQATLIPENMKDLLAGGANVLTKIQHC